MGDNISNQNGPYGTIQLSDGNGLFTGTDQKINVNRETGILHATQFIGDGGLLSNIQGGGGFGNILTGTPGEVAYYTGDHELSGLSNITVDGTTGMINIHSNTLATNIYLTSLIFELSDANVTNYGNTWVSSLQNVCEIGNTYNGTVYFENIITGTPSSNYGFIYANASFLTSIVNVAPGTYGNTISIPQITIDSNGRIFDITTTDVFNDKSVTSKTSATGTVDHNCNTVSSFYHTSVSDDFVINFQNLNLSDNETRGIYIYVLQNGTARTISGYQIDGSIVNNPYTSSNMAGHTNSMDIFRHTIIRTDTSDYLVMAEAPVQLV